MTIVYPTDVGNTSSSREEESWTNFAKFVLSMLYASQGSPSLNGEALNTE
jgi:hypothetical protein